MKLIDFHVDTASEMYEQKHMELFDKCEVKEDQFTEIFNKMKDKKRPFGNLNVKIDLFNKNTK